jgi:hypothetical protein
VTSRQFLQTSRSPRHGPRELLQTIFVAELLAPSSCLWIVSPWIRDVPVLDNSAGAFASLVADFPPTFVRLSRVLRELIERGTALVVATRKEAGNRQLLDSLGTLGKHPAVTFHERDVLHAKGLVGNAYSLIGSMNLTYSGVDRLDEILVFDTNAAKVEEWRLTFRNEYGGVL